MRRFVLIIISLCIICAYSASLSQKKAMGSYNAFNDLQKELLRLRTLNEQLMNVRFRNFKFRFTMCRANTVINLEYGTEPRFR